MLRRLTRGLFGAIDLWTISKESKFRLHGAGRRRRPASRDRAESDARRVRRPWSTRCFPAVVTGTLVVLLATPIALPELRFLTPVCVPAAILLFVFVVVTGSRTKRSTKR